MATASSSSTTDQSNSASVVPIVENPDIPLPLQTALLRERIFKTYLKVEDKVEFQNMVNSFPADKQKLSLCFLGLYNILGLNRLNSKFTTLTEIALLLENTILEVNHPLTEEDGTLKPGSCIVLESLTSSTRDHLLRAIMMISARVNIASSKYFHMDDMFEYISRVNIYCQTLFSVQRDANNFDEEEKKALQEINDMFTEISSSVFFIIVEVEYRLQNWSYDPEKKICEAPEECTVCLEELGGADFSILSDCIHTFCLRCTRNWFRENVTCPMCRADTEHWISEKKLRSFLHNNV